MAGVSTGRLTDEERTFVTNTWSATGAARLRHHPDDRSSGTGGAVKLLDDTSALVRLRALESLQPRQDLPDSLAERAADLLLHDRDAQVEEAWPPVTESGAAAWRESQDTLEQLNPQRQGAVRAFPAQRLSEELGSEYPAYVQFCGAPQHDLYHAGQIVILRQALSASREAA